MSSYQSVQHQIVTRAKVGHLHALMELRIGKLRVSGPSTQIQRPLSARRVHAPSRVIISNLIPLLRPEGAKR